MIKLRLFCLLVLLVALLGGCGVASNDDREAKGGPVEQDVNLRYMIWDRNQEPAYKQIISKFNEANPRIKVDIQVVPWGSYWEKLMTEIAGGTAPDVFWGYIPRVPSLADKKALLPITAYIKLDGLDLGRLNASLVKGFQYKGEQYGIPKDWDALGVFYNKEMLKEAGYNHYPQGLSWNTRDGGTFVEFLQKLTIDANGKHPNENGFDPKNIVQFGFNYTDRGEWDPGDLAGFAASNDADILVDGQFQPQDRLLDTMQFLHDLIFKYHVSPAFTDVKMQGSDQMFLAKQTALWITGSWQMIPVKNKAEFEWGIEPFPTGPNNKRAVRINGLADHIYAQTKHKEEAWKFVSFINSQVGQDILGKTGTVFPMNQASISRFIAYYKDLGVDPSVFIDEFNGDTVIMPITKNYTEWVQVWFKIMALIYSGEMDLKTGLGNLVKEGNPIAK
ncbi:sugar ABC transporter substrate-binding protein [Paenibacillus frigoriresistens]|uniref:ABC transporter substrate-binding protein n=1 Tax=Paenibacillus alginolyticus TaxID=59839 RepID=UPI0015668ECB|nr:sugar ABC transporter substrate-binding protein [Paenibacillus frigoriresistens]NRF90363.1 sugar ABC transporter substrate-binding protein [Paenibacillus frigoriresistens]